MSEIEELAEALQALAAESALDVRRYIERHGCPADGDCPTHGDLDWKRHVARIALERAQIERKAP